MVIEGALEGELDDHLGYGKHDPDGRNGGNSRNGHSGKAAQVMGVSAGAASSHLARGMSSLRRPPGPQ